MTFYLAIWSVELFSCSSWQVSLRIGIPWDSSPFSTSIWEYICLYIYIYMFFPIIKQANPRDPVKLCLWFLFLVLFWRWLGGKGFGLKHLYAGFLLDCNQTAHRSHRKLNFGLTGCVSPKWPKAVQIGEVWVCLSSPTIALWQTNMAGWKVSMFNRFHTSSTRSVFPLLPKGIYNEHVHLTWQLSKKSGSFCWHGDLICNPLLKIHGINGLYI